MKIEHDWIKSTLGHSFVMCKDCSITMLEAIAIGEFKCSKVSQKEKEGQAIKEWITNTIHRGRVEGARSADIAEAIFDAYNIEVKE